MAGVAVVSGMAGRGVLSRHAFEQTPSDEEEIHWLRGFE
jgi:hypothetical protein